MLGTIAWIVFVVLGVIGLMIVSIGNARALKRDVDRHREAYRASLEREANAIVEGILTANEVDTSGRP
jgi:hypothetical protein